MTDFPDLLSEDLAIDDLCERFETAWREGRPIRLSTILEDSTLVAGAQSRLFRELLLLEIEFRAAKGSRSTAAEYRSRFPEFSREVDAAFTLAAIEARGSDKPVITEAVTLNRFEVVRKLAQGGLGLVSEVRDLVLDREMALKEVRPDRDDAESRARLAREARLNGLLEHPGIVPVFGLGCLDDGRPFYVMRLVEGETLGFAIDRFHGAQKNREGQGERPLALEDLLQRFAVVCDATAYAHSKGVIHRDLKPSNVMLGRFGETLLVDWGLARRFDGPAGVTGLPHSPIPDDAFQTGQGLILGTPHYMSPEQATGDPDAVGPSSDIYSLGATLYHLLTGQPPYSLLTETTEIVRRHAVGDFVRPRSVVPNCPRALEAVCLKAMSLRPDDRYPSAMALADEIRRWIAGEPVMAREETWAERAWRWASRHRTPVVAVTSAALVGLIVGWPVALMLSKNEAEAKARDQGRVATLIDARSEALPGLLMAIRANPGRVLSILNEQVRNGKLSDEQKRNAMLALDPTEPDVRDFLIEAIGRESDFETLPLLCDALSRGDTKPVIAELWRRLEVSLLAGKAVLADGEEARPGEVSESSSRAFRIASALARLDPPGNPVTEQERWSPLSALIANGCIETVNASPIDFRRVLETFRPLRRILDEPLARRFREFPDRYEPTLGARRAIAAAFLDDYADTPEAVAGLIPDTLPGPRQGRYFARLRGWGEPGRRALRDVQAHLDDPRPIPGAPTESKALDEFHANRKSRVVDAIRQIEAGSP